MYGKISRRIALALLLAALLLLSGCAYQLVEDVPVVIGAPGYTENGVSR